MRGKQKGGEKKISSWKRKEKGKRKEKREERKERVGHALSDFRCFDYRKSIGRELKLVYSTRATSRCQKQKEVGFSPTLIPLNLRVVNDRVVQPQPWD